MEIRLLGNRDGQPFLEDGDREIRTRAGDEHECLVVIDLPADRRLGQGQVEVGDRFLLQADLGLCPPQVDQGLAPVERPAGAALKIHLEPRDRFPVLLAREMLHAELAGISHILRGLLNGELKELQVLLPAFRLVGFSDRQVF